MVALLRRLGLVAACGFVMAGISFAQTSSLEGTVKAADGTPLKGALVKIFRKDIKGNYQVKTDKKGHYFHAGLPLGTYRVSVEVDGKEMDLVDNVRTGLGDPKDVSFDLQEVAKRQQALQRAAETGQLTKEQERSMSAEQKAAIEKSMKERQAAMAKNTELNTAFNTGKLALEAKDYQAAVDAFKKAGELDPKQNVVWASLAESYGGLVRKQAGAEREQTLLLAAQTWAKAIELKPDDAAYHNNYALLLVESKKFPEAQAELEKAATIDPPGAGRYFYNLGAVLVNTGQLEPAGTAFKRSIEADPNYADAQYQYGMYLVSKATTTPDGKIVPPAGTVEAFQKYLQLKPDGNQAASAKAMLDTLSSGVQTTYKNPDAKKDDKKTPARRR
ncbi:MAG: carboxypeptidase regulatory-like domain-containing protein [Acidobacteria bacterium]|nr:carboxypeptidase regulatory-like domain-containing protein [Acidobacteriota bacterium]